MVKLFEKTVETVGLDEIVSTSYAMKPQTKQDEPELNPIPPDSGEEGFTNIAAGNHGWPMQRCEVHATVAARCSKLSR
jgi:hypothetical protein